MTSRRLSAFWNRSRCSSNRCAVVLLDAVDPDRAEQAQVLVQQAQLHRGVAHRRVGRHVGHRDSITRAVIQTRRPNDARKSVRIGETSRATTSKSAGQDVDARRDVQVGEHAVADIIDLARPEVDHRPDALGRQRRLAQPVHLAMDLSPQRRGDVGRRPGDDHPPPDRDDPDQDEAGSGPSPAASRAHPGCFASWARRAIRRQDRARPGAMDRVVARDTVGDQREDPRVVVQDEAPILAATVGLSPSSGSRSTRSAGNRASPREAIRATNRPRTPSSATISSDSMVPRIRAITGSRGSSGDVEPDDTRWPAWHEIPGVRGQARSSIVRPPGRPAGPRRRVPTRTVGTAASGTRSAMSGTARARAIAPGGSGRSGQVPILEQEEREQ